MCSLPCNNLLITMTKSFSNIKDARALLRHTKGNQFSTSLKNGPWPWVKPCHLVYSKNKIIVYCCLPPEELI